MQIKITIKHGKDANAWYKDWSPLVLARIWGIGLFVPGMYKLLHHLWIPDMIKTQVAANIYWAFIMCQAFYQVLSIHLIPITSPEDRYY